MKMHPCTSVQHSLNPDGYFTLPDWNLFSGPYSPIYETSVVKFLHLNDVLYAVFYFSVF